MQFFFFLIMVFVVFALGQKKLSVGSYLHCAIYLKEESDRMDVDESGVVTISVDPETISASVVSFCLCYLCYIYKCWIILLNSIYKLMCV